MKPFLISAPGKVIIFGEHSAVYSKPAIAAALSLRAYLLVTPNSDPDVILLDFPDIGLSHQWNRKDIAWNDIAPLLETKGGRPVAPQELLPELVGKLEDNLGDFANSQHYTTCYAFLYLYVSLCARTTPGMAFCVRSTLPIGAGLGLSASVAVCLSAALATLGQHIAEPQIGLHAKSAHNASLAADFVDEWSLVGEKCFHGNPSGIDNAVATYGGAVMYQRMTNPAVPSVRTTIRNFPPIDLLLTNTKIPRSTAALVGEVGRINREYGRTVGYILDAMGNLASEAYQVMVRPYFGSKETAVLRELININHGLLVALGVSHPQLEKIKMIGDTNGLGATKLTGAGGGGCAITLLGDDVEAEKLAASVKEFEESGFESLRTSLGGKGVGALLFDNVDEKLKETVFSATAFCGYEKREEIADALSPGSIEGWRFW